MNLELDAGTKRDLELLAQAEGKDPGVLLRELVHEGIEGRKANGRSPALTAGEQETSWNEFVGSMAEWSRNLPRGHRVDDSHESIYPGRGE